MFEYCHIFGWTSLVLKCLFWISASPSIVQKIIVICHPSFCYHGNGSPSISFVHRSFMAYTVSALSCFPAAAKLSNACSAVLAPGMTVETCGCAKTNCKAGDGRNFY